MPNLSAVVEARFASDGIRRRGYECASMPIGQWERTVNPSAYAFQGSKGLLHGGKTSACSSSCALFVRSSRHHRRSLASGSPREVIVWAVRWYLRYGLSYRDVEELLAERGVQVDHVTVFRWVQRFTPLLIDAARP